MLMVYSGLLGGHRRAQARHGRVNDEADIGHREIGDAADFLVAESILELEPDDLLLLRGQLADEREVLRFLAGRAPLDFFRRSRVVMLTAFTTSSSNATLPTTLRVGQEELGLPREVAGFVLPLGATLNMNGTALFEGVTVLFIAQVFGVPLDLQAQAMVVVLCVISAVGAAGTPSSTARCSGRLCALSRMSQKRAPVPPAYRVSKCA